MFQQLKNILGIKPSEDFDALVKQGAQIIDVRSKEEFNTGHIKGSINIPLQELVSHTGKIKKDKPVIVCCASGMRSASAKGMLQAKGFTVFNGGGWTSLSVKINQRS
jgi:phage shock protein E